jgi:release factor glutamine methyltransferase
MKFEDKVAQLRIKKHKGRETDAFLQDVKRMASGEPLEYILGEVTFCGATIDLSMRPMIPRPETEFWVNQVITELRNNERREKGVRMLDLFSGSGNVGLALLVSFPKVYVDMIELDPKLKEQIEISVVKNTIEKKRVRVITGDTWDGAEGAYDYVFAVPPYVPPEMKDEVMSELHAEDPLSFLTDSVMKNMRMRFLETSEMASSAKASFSAFIHSDLLLPQDFSITSKAFTGAG